MNEAKAISHNGKTMTDNGNKAQQTSASIVHLNDEDVVKIWDAVSAFIESYMKQSKGVIIPGFGTFSFIHKRIDIGNNKYLLLQRPVFALSERVAQTHGLRFSHHPINGSIPVHPLNYFYIQTQSNYSRDQIEQCVKHVLQVFNRSIASQRNVEFTFSRIGKLQIREGKVKMRFFKDFVSAVDENAAKQIIDNMCNRPQTCDSVMSAREAARPPTASNVVLPRLNSRIGNPSMQAIEEEKQEEEEGQGEQQPKPVSETIAKDNLSSKNDINRSASRFDDLKLPSLNDLNGDSNPSMSTPHLVKTTGTGTTHEAIIPIASLFSSMDLIQPSANMKRSPTPYTPLKRAKTSFYQLEQTHDPLLINPPPPNTVVGQPINENRSSSSLARTTSSMNAAHSQQIRSKSMTPCGHHGHGQEFCRVCHQRAKKNIPVYLHEEKRAREAEESKLLEQYQHGRDVEEQKKREAATKAAREEKQRIAAFNMGIAEATRAKKLERPQTEVPRSIIFRKRAKTPPSYLRQQDFARQLEAQIKSKQEEQRSEKRDKDFIERLEQIQLAESLSHERDAYMKNKRLHQEEMKSALENQIRSKPSELPRGESEAPYFGLSEMSIEKLKERRVHAMEIVRQQKEIVEQRQRQQLLKQVRDQDCESQVLTSIKQELISDNRERDHRTFTIRKDLENSWSDAMHDKHQRDKEEKQHLKAPQDVLVHEQCDQYDRCAQCQRNLNNTGKSNFWKDTRYIPGTHIMV